MDKNLIKIALVTNVKQYGRHVRTTGLKTLKYLLLALAYAGYTILPLNILNPEFWQGVLNTWRGSV